VHSFDGRRPARRRRLVCISVALAALLGVATTALVAAEPEVGKLNNYKVVKFPKPKKKFKVVLLQAHRSDAFAISSAKAITDFGRANGVDVTVNDAGGYQNIPKQISQIEAAILKKPDAIIFWSTDPTAVVPALKKAQKAGIKVIGYTQPPNMKTSFVVTGDFKLDGQTMASSLFKKMGGEGEAMLILGGAGSAYQTALQQGWDKALSSQPNVKVVATQTIPDFDPAKVQAAVENQLVRNPNLKGVMTSTTAMAAAASDAFAAAGKAGKAYSVGEIIGDCGQIRLLKEGRLAIVLGVPAVYYGRLVMADTIRLLQGLPVKKLTVIPGNVYTPANIAQAPLPLEISPQFRKGC
jgi:ABC-type sugar transport system substrate-binding protein